MSTSDAQRKTKVRAVKMTSGEMFIGKEVFDDTIGQWTATGGESRAGYVWLQDTLFVHAQVAQNGQMSTALLPWLSDTLKLRIDAIAVELYEIPQVLQDQYRQATSSIQIASTIPPMQQ